MKTWEQVAETVIAGSAGIALEKSITLPISTGNVFTDGLADVMVGLAAAYVGFKYVDGEELGLAVSAAGLGWAVSGAANMAGIQI